MSSSAWEELQSVALLGTERRNASIPAAAGALGAFLNQITVLDERAVLSAAAAITTFQRAGQLPSADGALYPVESAAPEERIECTSHAAQHLQAILGGAQRDLLGEWLTQLAQSGKRVPARCLPELLEAGRAQVQLRPQVRAAIGARGHWLAAQNPAWEYAAPDRLGERASSWEALIQIWELGSRSVRSALLEELRLVQPEQARNLIMHTWTTEKADDRAAFLGTLAAGLNMADEPFLESALDDRSKEVRTIAAQLLCQLPDSRLVQRMITRVTPLMRWAAAEPARLLGLQKGRASAIDVSLPELCDKAMARDGVEPKPVMQHQKLGERAQWLLQMLRAIPPRHWCSEWHTTPAELLAAAGRNEWKAVLEAAWISATQSSADPEWAEVLLRSDPSITSLLPILNPERQEALLLQLLSDLNVPLTQSPVLALIQQTTHPWSIRLTRTLLQAVHKHMRHQQSSRDYQLLSAFDTFARRMPPALVEEVASGWSTQQPIREHWQGAIDRMLITLQFRHDMAVAFTT